MHFIQRSSMSALYCSVARSYSNCWNLKCNCNAENNLTTPKCSNIYTIKLNLTISTIYGEEGSIFRIVDEGQRNKITQHIMLKDELHESHKISGDGVTNPGAPEG